MAATATAHGNQDDNHHKKFPFSSHQSAKICLKSALNIAHAFNDLAFPNPTGILQQSSPVFLSHTSATVCPRTMPSFACCAMQCAYALLMVHQKTKTIYPYSTARPPTDGGIGGGSGRSGNSNDGGDVGGGEGPQGQRQQQQQPGSTPVAVNSLLMRLQQGLTSIYATLANYATAFEALGGMRGARSPPNLLVFSSHHIRPISTRSINSFLFGW